jgi:hypothetical protein
VNRKTKGEKMKVVGYLGLVALGAALSGAAVYARNQTQPSQPLKFLREQATDASSSLVFLSDPKSAGCWLAVKTKGQGIVAIAGAPQSACY